MPAIVRISRPAWFDRWRSVPVYGRSLRAVIKAAEQYGDVLAEEVAAHTGRSPRRGRSLMALGHVLGWGGLALSAFGLFSLRRPELRDLVLGPFGIGLLMQLPSGALVRAGRRELRPAVTEEPDKVDRRRPAVVLTSMRSDVWPGLVESEIAPALAWYGPVIDAVDLMQASPVFGEADRRAEVARLMEQSVLTVLVAGNADVEASELEAIARRRLAHKLLVLLPPLPPGADGKQRWGRLRAALSAVPEFKALPEVPPAGALGIHLASTGETIVVTGPRKRRASDYVRAVDVAIYGMKRHGRW
jgi:hypothetical protein